jgi:hypothetical protein
MKLVIFSSFVLLCTLVSCEKARYDSYRVYEISIENEKQLEVMLAIENYPDGVRLIRFNKT